MGRKQDRKELAIKDESQTESQIRFRDKQTDMSRGIVRNFCWLKRKNFVRLFHE